MSIFSLFSSSFLLKEGVPRSALEAATLDAAIREVYLRDPGKLTQFALPSSATYNSWPMAYRTWGCANGSKCTKGAVNIACGTHEPAWMYNWVAHSFLDSGYGPVHAMSSRGYGENGPVLPAMNPDPLLLHAPFTTHSTDVVADFAEFVRLTRQSPSGKFFLLCHSFGCAVTTAWLQSENAAQTLFQAAVMNSPAFWPKTPAALESTPEAAQISMVQAFASSQPAQTAAALGESTVSKLAAPILSRVEWEADPMYWDKHQSYESFRRRSQVCNSAGFELAGCTAGSSWRYAEEGLELLARVRSAGCIVSDPGMPLVVQLVGNDTGRVAGGETEVDNRATLDLCDMHRSSCASKCTQVTYIRNGMHSTLMDVTSVRNDAFRAIVDVFDAEQGALEEFVSATVWTASGTVFASQHNISVDAGSGLTMRQIRAVQNAAATFGVVMDLAGVVSFGYELSYFGATPGQEYFLSDLVWTAPGATFAGANGVLVATGAALTSAQVEALQAAAAAFGLTFPMARIVELGYASLSAAANVPPPSSPLQSSAREYTNLETAWIASLAVRSTAWTATGAVFAADNGVFVDAGAALTVDHVVAMQSFVELLGVALTLIETIDFGYAIGYFEPTTVTLEESERGHFQSSAGFIALVCICSVTAVAFTVLAWLVHLHSRRKGASADAPSSSHTVTATVTRQAASRTPAAEDGLPDLET